MEHPVFKFDHSRYLYVLTTILLLLQALLLPFGTPSERFGMYVSVSLLACCLLPFISKIDSFSSTRLSSTFPYLRPLTPYFILYIFFPFLPSFSNVLGSW